MKEKSLTVLLSIVLILVLLPWCAAGAEDSSVQYHALREKEIRLFSVELFASGEYYRAITEAKRYISLFPEGRRTEEMTQMIGDCYLMSHEWGDAISAYDDFLMRFPESQLSGTVTFYKAIALVKQGNLSEAERLFKSVENAIDQKIGNDAYRWTIILLIRQKRFEEVEKILKERMLHPELESDSDAIYRLVGEKKAVRYKSPAIAGGLSAVLPGSGQFYNGRYRDGIYSFVLNALFILGAYKAYDADNYGLGGVLTLFEIGWYTGGVYGAVGGAQKFNREVDENQFRVGLHTLNLQDSRIGPPSGLSVMFSYPF